MRRLIFLWLLLLSPSLLAAPFSQIIEDFSGQEVGKFPKNFRTRPFQRSKAAEVYRVSLEGENRYLVADDAKDISVQIFRKFYWETTQYPILRWRWRAQILPKGADESIPSRNDSACGIYVVFGGYSGRSIKYIWSERQPVGKEISKKKGRSFSIVKASGPAGAWREVSTDVRADYRRLFGEEPSLNPIGFGILTDGNATHSRSACDYDEFAIQPKLP